MREGYFPVPNAQLYFREVGSGPPLVALHGGPDFDHNYLLPELDRLSSAFRLIYYDQRGRGRSSRGVEPEDVSIASEVDDFDRLRQYLGVDSVAVLGHSWGALLAIECAIRHPNRVSHLVVLNGAPASHSDLMSFRELRQATDAGRLASMQRIAETPEYGRGDIATEAEYYRLHFGATLRREDQLATVVGRLRVHFTPETILKARAIENRLYAQTWQLPDYDALLALSTLSTPTLVIHGDRDLIPIECANHVAEAARSSRLVVLKDCGHFAYLERSEALFRAIGESLSGH